MVTTTQKSIRRKRESLNKREDKIYEERVALGDICQHIDLSVQYGANTGDYDHSDDHYWTDVKCPDCGGRWRLDGSLREKEVRILIQEKKPRMCR